MSAPTASAKAPKPWAIHPRQTQAVHVRVCEGERRVRTSPLSVESLKCPDFPHRGSGPRLFRPYGLFHLRDSILFVATQAMTALLVTRID